MPRLRHRYGRRPYRPGVVALLVAVAFAVPGIPVIVGLVASSLRGEDLNPVQHVAVPALGLAFGFLWLYIVYRFGTMGIYVTTMGLVVRGPYSTRRIASAELVGVSMKDWQPPLLGRPTATPILELANHEVVAVWWLNARSFFILGGDGPDNIVVALRKAFPFESE